jgi:membrane protease YdiL (CAAX protease family)
MIGQAVRIPAISAPSTLSMVVVLGMAAMAGRPLGWAGFAVTALVGLAGLITPVPADADRGPAAWAAAVSVGMAALILARALGGPPGQAFPGGAAILASVVAAAAEEAYFRRAAYGWLARWGPAVAVGVTAVVFAAIHLPAYGIAALPVNLGAGLLFGWQRWVTGGWSAPAATHVAANLLAFA